MPVIKLNNYTSMDDFQKSLHKLLEEHYVLKNNVGNSRHARIKQDIDTLFTMAAKTNITAEWKR